MAYRRRSRRRYPARYTRKRLQRRWNRDVVPQWWKVEVTPTAAATITHGVVRLPSSRMNAPMGSMWAMEVTAIELDSADAASVGAGAGFQVSISDSQYSGATIKGISDQTTWFCADKNTAERVERPWHYDIQGERGHGHLIVKDTQVFSIITTAGLTGAITFRLRYKWKLIRTSELMGKLMEDQTATT